MAYGKKMNSGYKKSVQGDMMGMGDGNVSDAGKIGQTTGYKKYSCPKTYTGRHIKLGKGTGAN